MTSDFSQLATLAKAAKLRLLKMHFDAGVGHIGGNLSCLDLLLVTHHSLLEESDQFLLSKGHAAGALYVTLWSIGSLSDEDLRTFHQEGTFLAAHPPAGCVPSIRFGTGSLGHGLSLAAGMALARKLKSQTGRVFCLTSDGEWNEGSSWEALIFAAQNKLDNLVLIVDQNGLQGFGSTDEVARLDPLATKFSNFGFDVHEIDGHNHVAILEALRISSDRPRAIVAQTIKGKGVSFMEGKLEWHYWPMSKEQYLVALDEVERT
jgi:transketolase